METIDYGDTDLNSVITGADKQLAHDSRELARAGYQEQEVQDGEFVAVETSEDMEDLDYDYEADSDDYSDDYSDSDFE